MAAALLRHLWAGAAPGWELEVRSAGTGAFPGMGAADHAVTVLGGRGLDLSDHRSQSLTDQLLTEADLVLTMTRRHADQIRAFRPDMGGRVYTVGEYAGVADDIPDPFGGALMEYELTAQTLERLLSAVVARICNEGRSAP